MGSAYLITETRLRSKLPRSSSSLSVTMQSGDQRTLSEQVHSRFVHLLATYMKTREWQNSVHGQNTMLHITIQSMDLLR